MSAGLAVVLVAVVGGMSAGARAAARVRADNSMTYTPVGTQDDAAPMISTVVVSSNDSTITFQINTPNRQSFTSDMAFDIFVDNDNTPSTGNQSVGGADTALEVSGFGHATSLQDYFWDGARWGALPVFPDETWSFNSGLTVTVPRTAVEASDANGPVPAIAFEVVAWAGVVYDGASHTLDFTNAHQNDAPPPLSGFYSYDFAPQSSSGPSEPASISASSLKLSNARAGKVFTASILVMDDQSGKPAIDVEVSCFAKAAGKTLPVLKSSVAATGRATCSWRLPASSRGKRLKGKITASFPGLQSVSKSFTALIR
jgi:hypothetical protein